MAELLEIKDLAKRKNWKFHNEMDQAHAPEFLDWLSYFLPLVHWIYSIHVLSTGSVIRI